MTELYLYDDACARSFAPFALTRPLGEMRAGVELIRRRWERALGVSSCGSLSAAHLEAFEEFDAPPVTLGTVPAGAILANSRCVVSLQPGTALADVWMCEGRVTAVRLAHDLPAEELTGGDEPLESLGAAGTRVAHISGRWLDNVWDFVTMLSPLLREDIDALGPTLECSMPAEAIRLGRGNVFVEQGATVEPAVCFDTSDGPILIRAGATVRAFTRLVGPCAVASGATVLGQRVSGCSIGEMCIAHGELSETVMLGHANKSHDGFVGHSYLGRWVNLGAGTITSNLKNTYGTVHLWTPSGMRDTGQTKLGAFLGDHTKTGIGIRLTTGSILGAGSNVYGSTMPPKRVAPFSWGEGSALGVYRLDGFLETASRAMARRGVALSDGARRQLTAAYALRLEES
ncbi:MAG TPA: putative sugar nucleotidyl transferase [Gemmatimonadaceae bacterium]|jgi:UDP-N-acetylglucosamine diphosphorylase/glucosamine-1-phosphate N-acetyltransferase